MIIVLGAGLAASFDRAGGLKSMYFFSSLHDLQQGPQCQIMEALERPHKLSARQKDRVNMDTLMEEALCEGSEQLVCTPGGPQEWRAHRVLVSWQRVGKI